MPVSSYKIIVDAIEANIQAGRYPNGRIPSQDIIIARFGSSSRTVDKAWAALKARGSIVVKPGKGTFVNSNQRG